MQWNSVGDFFAMGGYALYVWGSYGVTAVVLAIEPLLVRKRRMDVLESLRRERRADEKQRKSL